MNNDPALVLVPRELFDRLWTQAGNGDRECGPAAATTETMRVIRDLNPHIDDEQRRAAFLRWWDARVHRAIADKILRRCRGKRAWWNDGGACFPTYLPVTVLGRPGREERAYTHDWRERILMRHEEEGGATRIWAGHATRLREELPEGCVKLAVGRHDECWVPEDKAREMGWTR